MDLIDKEKLEGANEAAAKEAEAQLTDEELDKVDGGADFWFWDREKRRPRG